MSQFIYSCYNASSYVLGSRETIALAAKARHELDNLFSSFALKLYVNSKLGASQINPFPFVYIVRRIWVFYSGKLQTRSHCVFLEYLHVLTKGRTIRIKLI